MFAGISFASMVVILVIFFYFRKAVSATAKTLEQELPTVSTSVIRTTSVAVQALEANALAMANENRVELIERSTLLAAKVKTLGNDVVTPEQLTDMLRNIGSANNP